MFFPPLKIGSTHKKKLPVQSGWGCLQNGRSSFFTTLTFIIIPFQLFLIFGGKKTTFCFNTDVKSVFVN